MIALIVHPLLIGLHAWRQGRPILQALTHAGEDRFVRQGPSVAAENTPSAPQGWRARIQGWFQQLTAWLRPKPFTQ